MHIIIRHCSNMNGLLQELGTPEEELPVIQDIDPVDKNDADKAEQNKNPVPKVVQAEIFFGGRNFK